MIRAFGLVLLLCAGFAWSGCGSGSDSEAAGKESPPLPVASGRQAAKRGAPKLKPPKGPPPRRLVVEDLIEGSGPVATPGKTLTVEYIGIHYDGSPFTNSWERRKPFRFELGGHGYMVNPGWEKGLREMRVGGRRKLVIPPALLYQGGAPAGTSPRDALVYVIDLVSAK